MLPKYKLGIQGLSHSRDVEFKGVLNLALTSKPISTSLIRTDRTKKRFLTVFHKEIYFTFKIFILNICITGLV